jgi:tetratricopeptide (TPR) repeat protein
MLGEMLGRAGDLNGAARCAETVFKMADATADARVRIEGLNLLSIAHRERSDFQVALGCFSELLETCRQIEHEQGVRIALNEIGGVCGLQGELEDALACHQQCLSANTKAQVIVLKPGANGVRALAPGVYFAREQPHAASCPQGRGDEVTGSRE